MTRVYAAVAVLALAAVLGASAGYVWWTGRADRFAGCGGGSVAGGPSAIGGPFELTRGDGVRVTDREVIDGPTLIYFGYTFCPDVCPIDVSRNAAAVDLLDERGHSVKPVFVTVDPARDTPEVVAEYAGYMHPRMVGLSGSEADIDAVKAAYRVFGEPAGDTSGGDYLVNHSVLSYLMTPDEGLAGFWRREATPEEMAESIACILDRL